MRISRVRDFLCVVTGIAVLSFGIGCGGSDDSGSSGGDTVAPAEDAVATSTEREVGLQRSDSIGFSFNSMMILVTFDEECQEIVDTVGRDDGCGPTFNPAP